MSAWQTADVSPLIFLRSRLFHNLVCRVCQRGDVGTWDEPQDFRKLRDQGIMAIYIHRFRTRESTTMSPKSPRPPNWSQR
jgi:hypothetical protein